MKILKGLFFVILAVVGIALITALFVKKDYAVEREIIIEKPLPVVFDYVKYLKNQDNYSVWAKKDPEMKKEYRGEDGTVGFVSAWDSQNEEVGKGEQEIMKITEGERIDYELRFFVPFEAKDNAYMITQANGENSTLVKWGFDGKMKYPMNLMLLFMDMEKMIGKDLEDGLRDLKTEVEKINVTEKQAETAVE